MKNIVLICAAGMSTSLLVSKMRQAAKDENYECTIEAYAIDEAPNVIPTADIVLLGPQVRFNQKKFITAYPNIKIECIEMVMYGTMNGKGVLDYARKVMG
jgi:PTS system cellobiose-specific IIB component